MAVIKVQNGDNQTPCCKKEKKESRPIRHSIVIVHKNQKFKDNFSVLANVKNIF